MKINLLDYLKFNNRYSVVSKNKREVVSIIAHIKFCKYLDKKTNIE